MNSGLTLVIKGADFSANNTGNGIFPSYQYLQEAIFWGNAIPDLAALKKSKGKKQSTLGTATLSDYAIKVLQSDVFPSAIQKLPNSVCTIALVLSRAAPANKTNAVYAVAKSGNSSASGVGDISLNMFETTPGVDTVMQIGLPNVINAVNTRTTVAGVSDYFVAVITLDSANLKVGLTLANDNGMKTTEVTASGLQANGSLYNTDTPFRIDEQMPGGMNYSALSVFNKALNAAEVKELVEYYKEFYKDAPAPL